MTKTLNKLENRNYLNIIKAIPEKACSYIIFNHERKLFSRSETRQRYPLSPLLFNRVLSVPVVQLE